LFKLFYLINLKILFYLILDF